MEIHKQEANDSILAEWSDRNTRKRARDVTTQGHANDLSGEIGDRSRELQPEVCPLRKEYVRAKVTATTSAVVVFLTFIVVVIWLEVFVGIKLYVALALVGAAIMIGTFAAFRARAIRRQDAQIPSVVTSEHVDEAALFVRLFGPVAPSDGVGMLILAVSGAADAALGGWVVATGMARSLSVIVVLTVSMAVATLFALSLRTLAVAFAGCCASIRAKLMVRRLAAMDFERYPEKRGDAVYAEVKLDSVAGHSFAEPTMLEYITAAAVLLSVPSLFGMLLAFRVYVANREGAASLQLLLGVSALLAVMAILGTMITGARGHILRDEGVFFTMLNRRFCTRGTFESWLAAHGRWTRRWGNEVARRLNDELQKNEARGDRRCVKLNIVVPRPFPEVEVGSAGDVPQPANDATVTVPTDSKPANDKSAAMPKEVA